VQGVVPSAFQRHYYYCHYYICLLMLNMSTTCQYVDGRIAGMDGPTSQVLATNKVCVQVQCVQLLCLVFIITGHLGNTIIFTSYHC